MAGLTLGTTGGAFAIVQRKHRPIASSASALQRGPLARHKGLDEYKPRAALVRVEKFGADMPRASVVARVFAVANMLPFLNEITAIANTGDLGETWREPFYSSASKGLPAWFITITREATVTPQSDATPLADIKGTIVKLSEDGRLKFAGNIQHNTEVARLIEYARSDDDMPHVALAIGIALHRVELYGARGPWPGKKPPPQGSPEAAELSIYMELKHELAQAEEDEAEGQWWPR